MNLIILTGIIGFHPPQGTKKGGPARGRLSISDKLLAYFMNLRV